MRGGQSGAPSCGAVAWLVGGVGVGAGAKHPTPTIVGKPVGALEPIGRECSNPTEEYLFITRERVLSPRSWPCKVKSPVKDCYETKGFMMVKPEMCIGRVGDGGTV